MRGFRLGKIAGFQINADWSWLVIFFLIVYMLGRVGLPPHYLKFSPALDWLTAFAATVLLFASVLAHELMHSVVARLYGMDIKGITLFIFGGVSQTKGEPQTPQIEFQMAIAGPLTSFALGGIFYALTAAGRAALWPRELLAITGYVGWINVILGIFNLVPGFPLDGGRVLRSALWATTRSLEKATRYASYAGQGFGYILMGLGFMSLIRGFPLDGIWAIVIGWFLSGLARSSYEQVVLKEALSGVEVGRVMTTDVPTVTPELTVDDFVHDYLMRHEYACYPVIDGERVKGIVSIDEVRALPRDQWPTTAVGEIAVPVDEGIKIRSEDDAWDALMKLASEDTRRLLVMHDGHLDGTVTQENILRLVRTKMQLGV